MKIRDGELSAQGTLLTFSTQFTRFNTIYCIYSVTHLFLNHLHFALVKSLANITTQYNNMLDCLCIDGNNLYLITTDKLHYACIALKCNVT